MNDKLYGNKLTLYVEPSSFIIKQKSTSKTMIIDKITKKLEIKSVDKVGEGIDIFGILGVIEAPATNYLVLIMNASRAGSILNADIYKVEEVRFLPYVNSR